MRAWRRIPPTLVVVSGTLAVLAACWLCLGAGLFSPGPLHATPRGSEPLGGVRNHAELAQRCGACHPRPFAGSAMADLCLECHRDVRQQITAGQPLHGRLDRPGECRSCHTEHAGPRAALTDLSGFDHSLTAFALTGTHLATRCAACHADGSYKGTPTSCVACHAEPPVHAGRFGTDCAKCHSTRTWKDVEMDMAFHRFPVRHGGGRRRGECAACHDAAPDYRTYTCYGCHEHEREKMVRKHRRVPPHELDGCVTCHPTGREHEGPHRDRDEHEERRERTKPRRHEEPREREQPRERTQREVSTSSSPPPAAPFDVACLAHLESVAAWLRDAQLTDSPGGTGHGCPALGPVVPVGRAASAAGVGDRPGGVLGD